MIRLEDGDVVHECLEAFARRENVRAASITLLGGIDEGSRLVVGPRHPRASGVEPMSRLVTDVREVVGAGTLFPDAEGNPAVHLHIACGREDQTLTGCVRLGVRVWHVMEAIVVELVDTHAVRRLEPATGFELLQP